MKKGLVVIIIGLLLLPGLLAAQNWPIRKAIVCYPNGNQITIDAALMQELADQFVLAQQTFEVRT